MARWSGKTSWPPGAGPRGIWCPGFWSPDFPGTHDPDTSAGSTFRPATAVGWEPVQLPNQRPCRRLRKALATPCLKSVRPTEQSIHFGTVECKADQGGAEGLRRGCKSFFDNDLNRAGRLPGSPCRDRWARAVQNGPKPASHVPRNHRRRPESDLRRKVFCRADCTPPKVLKRTHPREIYWCELVKPYGLIRR